MFTGIKDIDIKILLNLNDKDLCSCFQIKYFWELSENQYFWMQLVIKKYGFHLGSCETIRQKYLNGRTWKEYYMIYVGSKYKDSYLESYFSKGGGRFVGLYIYKSKSYPQRKHFNKKGELDGFQEKYFYEDKLISNYKSGKKNGIQKIWKGEILISEEFYEMEKKSGTHKKWYVNGMLKYSHDFKNDKPFGLVVGWFPNGQMQYHREFSEGGLLTKDLKWDEYGNPRKIDANGNEYVYKNSEWVYYES